MPQLDRNIFVVATVAGLRSIPGEEQTRYCFVQELGYVFLWHLNSTRQDDGRTAIVPTDVGGFLGAWEKVGQVDRGADLVLASGAGTIGVYGGGWRVVPIATLTGAVAYTLDPTSPNGGSFAPRGETIMVTRYDATGFALTINTVAVPPRNWILWWADGAGAWLQRSAGALL